MTGLYANEVHTATTRSYNVLAIYNNVLTYHINFFKLSFCTLQNLHAIKGTLRSSNIELYYSYQNIYSAIP